MRWVLSIWFLLYCLIGSAQPNLVPNPSFEIIDNCPNSAGDIGEAPPWRKVGGGGGVPLFHECGWNGYGMPVNWGGHQYPRTGLAYADFINYIAPYEDLILEGNLIGVPLDSALKEGHKYSVEFYINLMDSMLYATRNIGAHFSVTQPPDDIVTLLGLEPQVQYTDSAYLSNKEDWMRISGDFIAEGGESFLTIGNFDGHHESDTLYIGNGGPPYPLGNYYWEAVYYYLDDVSVVEDTSYHVGIENRPLGSAQGPWVKVWPNPASDFVSIELKASSHKLERLVVNDAMGRKVLRQGFDSAQPDGKLDLDVSSWENGVYVFNLWDGNRTVHRKKLVVQH